MLRLGYVSDPRFLDHDTGAHVECPARLVALDRHLAGTDLAGRLVRLTPEPATPADVGRVHTPAYIERLRHFAQLGGGWLDPDTVMGPASHEAALLAAGAGIAAARAILDGRIDRAFCAVRPPGHHACADRAMGFCLYNNVAVLARWLAAEAGASRILIVDFDVHHGNGTQEAFEADPDVWFVSLHQYPHYPGSGSHEETGTGPGRGTIFNLPVPAGAPREACLAAWAEALRAAAAGCRPEWVLVSAGFDAHEEDYLAGLALQDADYARLTEPIVAAAQATAQGRIVSLLEGGYNLDALGRAVEQHLRALEQ